MSKQSDSILFFFFDYYNSCYANAINEDAKAINKKNVTGI